MKKKINILLRNNTTSLYEKIISNFGFGFAVQHFFLKNLAVRTDYKLNFYNAFIQRRVSRYFADLVNGYKDQPETYTDFSGKIPVFAIWWQGEENMPDVIKLCIASHRQAFADERFEYHLITQDNLADYLEIPSYILDKAASKSISLTHLSDIIRVGLMKKYGGFYCDADFYLPRPVPAEVFERPIYSIRKNNSVEFLSRYVPQGKWHVGLWYARPNTLLFSFVWDAFLYYFRYQTMMMDYFLLDYVIDLAYRELPIVKEEIDDIPLSANTVYQLRDQLNEPGDMTDIAALIAGGSYFKLSWKKEKHLEKSGRKTRYAKLLEQYGIRSNGR